MGVTARDFRYRFPPGHIAGRSRSRIRPARRDWNSRQGPPQWFVVDERQRIGTCPAQRVLRLKLEDVGRNFQAEREVALDAERLVVARTQVLALSVPIALREALAQELGVEADEMGFDFLPMASQALST